MTPNEMVGLALEAARDGLSQGELPIGAVVLMGDDVVGRGYTQERTQGRRLVHADFLAMEEADRRLGWTARQAPLLLAVTLEPCLMCLGAAMALGIAEVYYGLEAPSDGAAGLADVWQPAQLDMPFSLIPTLAGGFRRLECRDLFGHYAATAPESGMRRYAEQMAELPDTRPTPDRD